MFGNLLSIVSNNDGNYYFDNFGEAALYAIIGLVVVFVGICLIIAIIWLIGLLMRKTNNLEFIINKKNKKSANTKNPPVESQDDEIPDEVKVAIVAAIMAYYEQENPTCQFKVKRIKRL